MPDLVSFAAVIRVVTRHASGEERCVRSDDPNNGCEGDYAGSRPGDKRAGLGGVGGGQSPKDFLGSSVLSLV